MAKEHNDKDDKKWIEYRDPMAPEKANPYKWVDGYKVEKQS